MKVTKFYSIGPAGERLKSIGTGPVTAQDISTIEAECDAPASRVNWVIDGKAAGKETEQPYQITLKLAPGSHTIRAVPYGTDGKIGTSKTITVTLSEAPKPQVPSTCIDGTIVENDRADKAGPLLRELGLKLVRNWCSLNFTTGKINWVDCIKRTNEYVDAGFATILTVSVDEVKKRTGGMCQDYGTDAIAQQFNGLSRKCIIQLANEINLSNYWPNGDYKQANKLFCVPLAKKLKAMGFRVAAPSLTYQTPSGIQKMWDEMRADTPAGLWDYIDGHSYSKNVATLEAVLKTYKGIADSFGVTFICTEWGMPHHQDHAAFVKVFPAYLDVVRKYCSHQTYFIGSWTEKFASVNRCPYFFRTSDGSKGLLWDAMKANKR